MKVIDLYCGMGGWVQAFPKEWDVTGYDVMDFSKEYQGKFVQCDLLEYNGFPEHPDLIVASPPCTEFSKASMPKSWACNRKEPDIDMAVKLFSRAQEIIKDLQPEWWIIENVRGSQKYMGKADMHIGSRYLWTNMEIRGAHIDDVKKSWLPPSKNRPALRAMIPYGLSALVVQAMKGVFATSIYTQITGMDTNQFMENNEMNQKINIRRI